MLGNERSGTIHQSVTSTATETQTISMTDVISEGPIAGLVDGVASVHLNDSRLTERTVCTKFLSRGPSYFVAKNNSTTADLRIYGASFEMDSEVDDSIRHLVIRDSVGKQVSLEKKKVSGGKGGTKSLVLVATGINTYASDRGFLSREAVTYRNGRAPIAAINKPVRLQNPQGDEIGGRLTAVTTGSRSNQSDNVKFARRGFDTVTGERHISKKFDIDDEDTIPACTLFFDHTVEVTSLNSTTVNSDGSTTFNVTLEEAWTHNESFTPTSITSGSDHINFSELITFKTGDRIIYRNNGSGSNITGLTPDTVEYFAINVDSNSFSLATTRANAFAGTAIDITGVGGLSDHSFELVGQKFDDMGYSMNSEQLFEDLSEASVLSSVASTQVQFRSGTLGQAPMSGSGGVGSSAITNAIGLGISQTNESGFGGEQAPIVLNGISSTGFGLASSIAPEVDEIRIRWAYNSGFKGIYTSGSDFITRIRYKISIFIKEIGEVDFSTTPSIVRNLAHEGEHSNAVSFEETFNIAQLAPFIDFQVKIERQDADNGDAYKITGGRHGGATNVTKASITSVTSILNEKMSHPLTAMAKVSYSSKEFQQTPTRSYHCRGMLVKVPSNYITREETGGAAKYTGLKSTPSSSTASRNSAEIFDTGTYQDWDGTFRNEKVYTNNPAWVFYDIITNNRYGLGDFVNESDIDKYALYRIARYCDEEVDDGNGTNTTEPRYTMNTYLVKSTDAQKVLKDMLTNFVSMLYYLDGQIHPVQDSPSGPIYNFTKSNVLNGEFTYEHAGTKTRTNQVVVSWNNPENNFKPEPLIVEDRKDIVKTGKTISKKVVAYGCTSRGQALRYGKWKLFTSINQQEIVSFKTGINGSFITPGDVINVQNADRDAVRLGGRISGTGTLNTTTIPIDSAVTIDANNTYDLSVILQKDAAFLTQSSASIAFTASGTTTNTDKTVTHSADSNIRPGLKVTGTGIPADTVIASLNSTTSFELSNAATTSATNTLTFTADYVQGDSVTHAYIDHDSDGTYTLQAIDSSTDAVNAKASATGTEGLLLSYKDAFVVETQAVDKTATGTGSQSSIVVSTGFTSTPTAEDMWVLQEKESTGLNIAGSAKEYKVLAITEDDNHQYAITAVEHFDSKYEAIEQDFTLYVPDELNRPIKSTDIIPKPTDVFVQVIQTPAGEHETVRVFFTTAPASSLTVTGLDGADTTPDRPLNYEFAAGMEITHNIPGYSSPLVIPYEASVGFYDFLEVPVGKYEVQVRTVAVNNNRSLPVRRPFEVVAILRNRIAGYFPEAAHSGGSSTKGVEII
jgi:predicted phage tail protein